MPTQYTAEQMAQMLVAGAEQIDRYPVYAAIHLLTFTDLPGRASFTELVDVEDVNDVDGAPIIAAFVRDWRVLPSVSPLGSAAGRLLALAAGLATGELVDLAESLSGLGHAHARRVIEAVAIATGYGEMFTVAPTEKLDELLAARDALTR